MIWRWLYRLAWYLVLPLVFVYLWRRGRKQPAYRRDWSERLGRYPVRPTRPVIWLHAVSVGETRAALPLIQALMARHPDHDIVLTQMTPTGRETARQLLGERVILAYLPYDMPFAVKRFLRHFQPRYGVLMEMEIWPNLIHCCQQNQVPLYLVNARLSARSQKGYAKVSKLIRPALSELTLIAAQSEMDAQRLREIGAPAPQVLGNLKFDFVPNPAQIDMGKRWRTLFGSRPVWIAASTREGEEALLLDALARSSIPANALLILVPRHPQRFDEVADLLTQRGIEFTRRSAWDGVSNIANDVQILLGDSMGELIAYYAAADIAVMGGSLLAFGSHSPIEPCSIGLPTLLGPSDFNFAEAIKEAVSYNAARQYADADEVLAHVATLLAKTSERQAMGQAGLAFVAKHRGVLVRTLALLPGD